MFLSLYKKAENYSAFYAAKETARRLHTHGRGQRSAFGEAGSRPCSPVPLRVFPPLPRSPGRPRSLHGALQTQEGRRHAEESDNNPRRASGTARALLTPSAAMSATELRFCSSRHYTTSYSCAPASKTASKSERAHSLETCSNL